MTTLIPTGLAHVSDESSVLLGLRRLDLVNRSPLLPSVYCYEFAHPLHGSRLPGCHTYVCLVDPSAQDLSTALSISCSTVPESVLTSSNTNGYLCLEASDALLACSIHANCDPGQDCLIALGGIFYTGITRESVRYMEMFQRACYTPSAVHAMVTNVLNAQT
ncbi:hypothetical protein BC629DRAFT_1113803 [Irpex lacteus]|nr:hypothetical protein BC629DRAFT_1113803 [Irpex lacteus]